MKLKIDNQHQTIQGIYIPSKESFQQIRFVVENNHLEGWNPSPDDIEHLLKTVTNPDLKIVKEYQNIFGDNNE